MRVTVADLEAVCQRINRAVNGSDMQPYVQDDAGGWHANVDAYHLSGAYGGYSLHRTVNESGGISDVFGCGHVPKRELYDRMQSFLRGIEAVQS